MNGVLKLGLMTFGMITFLWALSYVVVELLVRFDDWRNKKNDNQHK